ncbi:MAG TPA: S8 family serine peptidase [Solirubrobacterales bacterium]|nr:S8 family serine peptidase [Solirubrobacterales bacterium]
MGVVRRAALTLCALAASIAAGTATAADGGASLDLSAVERAVVRVATPKLPVGRDRAARERWRELRFRSQAILDRVAAGDNLSVETAVPELGLLSVDVGSGGFTALRGRLAADPRVESVRPDVPVQLRFSPDDFAYTHPDPRAPNGDLGQWNLLREGASRAWDLSKGNGALVAMVDTGVDGGHPDLSPRIAGGQAYGTISPLSDSVGHGTHAAGLACGASGNGYGIASVGFRCGLFIEKIVEGGSCSNVSAAVVDAANRNADVINMSIGGCDPAIVDALNYAQSRGPVIVVAGANEVSPSGSCNPELPLIGPFDCLYPEEWAQPNGTGPNAGFDRGLVVTSARYDGARSSFAEATNRVSVAAYGSATNAIGGQQGVLSTWPASPVEYDAQGGRSEVNGDPRFAYLVGTSMATPQVAGVAALIRSVKPGMANTKVVHLIKETAGECGRYGGGLGWGIVRADEAVIAALGRDVDPPSSRVRSAKRAKSRNGALIRVRLKRKDTRQRHCAKGLPVSGVRKVVVFASRNRGRYHRIGKTRSKVLEFHRKRRGHYRFLSVAVDRSGNREARPATPDAKLR